MYLDHTTGTVLIWYVYIQKLPTVSYLFEFLNYAENVNVISYGVETLVFKVCTQTCRYNIKTGDICLCYTSYREVEIVISALLFFMESV